MKKRNKTGQVWIETVVYTLIGLTIIGIILSMALPRIEKMKDRAIIDQTVVAMNILNDKILEVEQSQGSVGIVNFKIAKGSLEINGVDNLIKYVLEDTKLEASEPGVNIDPQGNIILKTEKKASRFEISLTMEYDNLNITYSDEDKIKILNAGATPYKISISNKGTDDLSSKTQLDFEVI